MPVRRRPRLTMLVPATALLLAFAPGIARAAPPQCPPLAPFDPASFTDPTRIDNRFLPLVPGTQTVLEGRANRGGGALPHRVTFTVTDLTKVIAGVRTVVVWDVDVNEGQLVESELAFWAQDRDGNVWNLGEYPEEYDAGTLIGAPSTWLAGLSGAEAGIHMAGQPVVSNKWYVQGYAEAVDFFDCAHVLRIGQVHTVPAGTFQDVLTTEERSPLDPQGGYQLKRHAPGVGIVKVEPVNDPEGETLVMVERRQLGADELAAARAQALEMEARAYRSNTDYAQTAPAQAPAPPPPPAEQAPAAAPAVVVAAVQRRPAARLAAATARSVVRRALRQRLKGWTIVGVDCSVRGGTATCRFTARRRGASLRGAGTVTRSASASTVRYALRARVRTFGCRPVTAARCNRDARWTS